MENCIKFYLNDETLHYKIKKSFGKVVFQNNKNLLLIEVESTDDLDHVEGDSLQNEFPEIILSIEDFPVNAALIEELIDQPIHIPLSFEEVVNEEEELVEYYYTNLNLNNEEDLETNNNHLSINKDDNGNLFLTWKGECEHFENEGELIKFKVSSELNFKKPVKDYDE